MKRYRLVEASYLSGYGMLREEAAIGAVKKALAPIKNRTFKLDWDKIEDRLGGPVPYNVREKVEAVCSNGTFKGFKLIKIITLVIAGAWYGIVFGGIFFKPSSERAAGVLLLSALILGLIGIINLFAMLILAKIHGENINKTDIAKCVKSARNGELKSDVALKAVNEISEFGWKTTSGDVFSLCVGMIMSIAVFLTVS